MSITVNVDLKEIYALLCEKCRRRVRELVQRKISEKLADQVIGLEDNKG
jgi:transcriptional regulator of met regulon